MNNVSAERIKKAVCRTSMQQGRDQEENKDRSVWYGGESKGAWHCNHSGYLSEKWGCGRIFHASVMWLCLQRFFRHQKNVYLNNKPVKQNPCQVNSETTVTPSWHVSMRFPTTAEAFRSWSQRLSSDSTDVWGCGSRTSLSCSFFFFFPLVTF